MKNLNYKEKLGGTVWERGDKRRLYFSDSELQKIYGLKIDRYKTGNICSAFLDGSRISNSKAADILIALSGVWIDLNTGKINTKYELKRGCQIEIFENLKSKINGILGL